MLWYLQRHVCQSILDSGRNSYYRSAAKMAQSRPKHDIHTHRAAGRPLQDKLALPVRGPIPVTYLIEAIEDKPKLAAEHDHTMV